MTSGYHLIITSRGLDNLIAIDGEGTPAVRGAITSLMHPEGKCTVLTDDRCFSSLSKAVAGIPRLEVIQTATTRGALCTALLAADSTDSSVPVVVAPGNSYFTKNISSSISSVLDVGALAGTITLHSDSPDLSYLRISRDGQIEEVLEKRAVSDTATTGVFIFRSSRDFLEAGQWVIVNNMNTRGEFYTSAAMNKAILSGGKVVSISVESTGSEFVKPNYGIRTN